MTETSFVYVNKKFIYLMKENIFMFSKSIIGLLKECRSHLVCKHLLTNFIRELRAKSR